MKNFFLVLLVLSFFSGCCVLGDDSHPPDQAQTITKPTYHVLKLSDTLYELRIDVGFIVKVLASIGPDGTLLVDAGSGENGKELLSALDKLGCKEPRIVILSHSHEEHWGGARIIGKGPLYIGHENLRYRLLNGPYAFLNLPENILPQLTTKDGLTIHFNGEEIRIRAFAGAHDDSDLVVWFTKSKVAYVGALVTACKLPTVDYANGNICQYPSTTRNVLNFLPEDVKLVPGHGEDATHAEGLFFLDMLEKTAALVKEGITRGKDLETMLKEDLLKGWKSWEVSYSSRAYWLSALYDGYSGQASARLALKTIHGLLFEAYKTGGSLAAIQSFYDTRAKHPNEYRFDDRSLYSIAAILVEEGKNKDAIPFLEVIIKEFPKGRFVLPCLDTLCQAYLIEGNKPLAIRTLKQILERVPDNKDAANRLRNLESSQP